jgi:hypothetical protein
LADWWWPRGYRTYQVSWWTWSFSSVPFRAPWRVHKAQCRCCVCIPAQESCPQWPCFVNDWYPQASSWYGLQESNPLASSTWRLYQSWWCPTWLANETTWEGMSTKSKMWQMSLTVAASIWTNHYCFVMCSLVKILLNSANIFVQHNLNKPLFSMAAIDNTVTVFYSPTVSQL